VGKVPSGTGIPGLSRIKGRQTDVVVVVVVVLDIFIMMFVLIGHKIQIYSYLKLSGRLRQNI